MDGETPKPSRSLRFELRVEGCPQKLLHAFAAKFPELESNVARSLDCRLRVEKEFRRLAGDMAALPCVSDSLSHCLTVAGQTL